VAGTTRLVFFLVFTLFHPTPIDMDTLLKVFGLQIFAQNDKSAFNIQNLPYPFIIYPSNDVRVHFVSVMNNI
jgi:hypothetical protein